LGALAAGDAGAATAFVRRHQARVFGLAYTMVGDRGAAEEIAQETFLRAWRHAGAYDPRRGQVATWLLSIARNLAIDHLRLRRPDPVDPERLPAVEAAVVRGGVEGRAQVASDVSQIRDALATLPLEQRRALLMATFLGLTAREISAIEGAPLGTAKTRIRSAMQKLRAELEVEDER
jgi:RNA polymerase sigma factor (sigma-70 family)